MSRIGHAPDPPPQLDVLSEIPTDALQRSSTFRACLEKAVDDINVKYGTATSTCLPNGSVHGNDEELGHCTHTIPRHVQTNFQPRYRFPKLVHVPPRRSQPAHSELKQVLHGLPHGGHQHQARAASLFADRHDQKVLDQASRSSGPSAESLIGGQAHNCQPSYYNHSKASSGSGLSPSLSPATSIKSSPRPKEPPTPSLRRISRRLEGHDAASALIGSDGTVPGKFPKAVGHEASSLDSGIVKALDGSRLEDFLPGAEAPPSATAFVKPVRSAQNGAEPSSVAEGPPLHSVRALRDKHAVSFLAATGPIGL